MPFRYHCVFPQVKEFYPRNRALLGIDKSYKCKSKYNLCLYQKKEKKKEIQQNALLKSNRSE